MAKARTNVTKKTGATPTAVVMSAEKLKFLAEKKAASEAAYAAYRKAHPLPLTLFYAKSFALNAIVFS